MKDEQDLVQKLLAHDADVAIPTDHERRIREGLGGLLGAMPAAPAPPPAATPPAAPAPAPVANAVANTALRKWATTGLVAAIAAGGGFAAGRATAPPSDTPPKASLSTALSTPTPPSTLPQTPTTATSAEPLTTASASASTPVTPSAVPAATSASGDGFDREQSLLERARAALVRHDAAAAEKALDEHDRQFPRSRLAEERDYLRIQVLRERGDAARVRERAKAFLVKYPESMLRARVEPLAQ